MSEPAYYEPCPYCDGTGCGDPEELEDCVVCGGSGKIERYDEDDFDMSEGDDE
jgi:DnaJ-class molecular chaperone with C-terminal Zn finger domain